MTDLARWRHTRQLRSKYDLRWSRLLALVHPGVRVERLLGSVVPAWLPKQVGEDACRAGSQYSSISLVENLVESGIAESIGCAAR